MQWGSAFEALPVHSEVQLDLAALRSTGENPSLEALTDVQSAVGGAAAIGASLFSAPLPKAAAHSGTSPQPSLSNLLAVQPLPCEPATGNEAAASGAGGDVAVFIVKAQVVDSDPNVVCSLVTLHVSLLHKAPSSGAAAAKSSLTLQVEVVGYDVNKSGHFRQLLVCASGRGVLLVAPRCCAGVAVPAFDEAVKEETVRAVPLVPPTGVDLVKVMWHPLSDAHIGVLLSDSTWQLLNIAHRVALLDPEVSIPVTFGECEPNEQVADFTFGTPSGAGIESVGAHDTAWLAVAVLFLSNRGKISVCSPVLPSLAVFPTAALDALQAPTDARGGEVSTGMAGLDAQEWLQHTLLCSANRRTVPLPGAPQGAYCSIRHPLHLHGDSEAYFRCWTPVEQVVAEARSEGEVAPLSPRGKCNSYCSLQLVAHYPVAMIARATTSGLVEIVILSGAVAPKFNRRDGSRVAPGESLSCSVFEEIDLVQGPSKAPTVSLSTLPSSEGNGTTLVARTRTLVAAIELPWLASLHTSTVESIPSATVMTLMEAKAADGPAEIVGWQVLPANGQSCLGLALRARDRSASATDADTARGVLPQSIDIASALKAAAKTKGSKEPPSSSSTTRALGSSSGGSAVSPSALGAERDEYLRCLSTPLLLPSPLFGAAAADGADPPSASSVAKAVAAVQSGQLAALSAKQLVLKEITTQAPTRLAATTDEVANLRKSGSEIRKKAEKTESKVAQIRERQLKLEEQHKTLTGALTSQLELQTLDGTAAEELPRLWSQLHELRQAFELLRAAAAPQNPQELAGLSADWLCKVENLQRTWTDTTAESLRDQARDAEALAMGVSSRSFGATAAA